MIFVSQSCHFPKISLVENEDNLKDESKVANAFSLVISLTMLFIHLVSN